MKKISISINVCIAPSSKVHVLSFIPSFADICRCEVGLTIVRHVSLPLRVLTLFYGDIAIVRLRNLLCPYCYIFVILDQN